jgi:nucleoid DNA-binding protein
LNVCPACGGDWFREADYYEFLREETLGYFQETWPLLVGQLSRGIMTLLVCLCGSPLAPDVGGLSGKSFFNELLALRASLRKVLDRLEDIRSDRSVLAGLAGQPASPEAFAALVSRLENVERVLARRLHSGRGRPWQSPTRKPRAKGRDQLVIAVQQRAGLTARKARSAVTAFWNIITRTIWRGEIVETPWGTFKARSGPEPKKLKRLGKDVTVYRRERRIVFQPSETILADSEVPASKEDSVPQANVPRNQLVCEKCGSTHFVEGKFHQYRQQYSSTPGSELSPVTEDPIRALVCMCGHPIQIRKHRGLSLSDRDRGEFKKSFEAARRCRQAAEPQTIVDRISPTLVNREEYAKLAEQIANLETILRLRLPDLTPSPDSPPPATGS